MPDQPHDTGPRSVEIEGDATVGEAQNALRLIGGELPDPERGTTVAEWIEARLGRPAEDGDDLEAGDLVVDVLGIEHGRASRVRFTRVEAGSVATTTPAPAPRHRPAPPRHTKPPKRQDEGSVKETIISMLIALAMALVAKVYVVEAFVIPTGSMAPTLYGQHMLFRSDVTGAEWAVNPWYYHDPNQQVPMRFQGVEGYPPPVVSDPMTVGEVSSDGIDWKNQTFAYRFGFTPLPEVKRLRAGDRILVQKYLYEVFPPERYDVVVFKNPEDAKMNFIKRLVGLPNEQVWLADGDVFARPFEYDVVGVPQPTGPWTIQRKPDRVQQALWRTIFSSEFTPSSDVDASGRRIFSSPWIGDGWDLSGRRTYRSDAAAGALLEWDANAWPISDWEPYNDIRRKGQSASMRGSFPIADLRARAGVRADTPDALRATVIIEGRGHEFAAEFAPGRTTLKMRELGEATWTDVAQGSFPAAWPGHVTNVELWHVDQALSAWVDGEKVAEATYDWSPERRMDLALGPPDPNRRRATSFSLRPGAYTQVRPGVRLSFDGSPVTLTRVGLDRDIYYQPRERGFGGNPGLGTHPGYLATLDSDQFFMLGDNSPSSKDGRLWDKVDPPIRPIDPDVGVVNRKLLLGKAFFVYWPAVHPLELGNLAVPVPDFGSMRFIR